MKNYFTLHEWSVIEEEFNPEYNKFSESIFSIGNGRMGQRANFEERFSGQTLAGHYVAGIYYPYKTRVGWWKNGYPEYFTKVPNAPGWIGIYVNIDGYELDLATCQVLTFRRELNMREGYLYRRARVLLPDGKEVEINSLRFTSLADDELGAIRFAVTPLNFSSPITFTPYLDGGVANAGANSGEKIWAEISRSSAPGEAYLTAETDKTAFRVCTGMRLMLEKDGSGVETTVEVIDQENYVGNKLTAAVEAGQEFVLYKYAAVVSSENYAKEKLNIACELALDRATSIGFAQLLEAHGEVWAEKWQESDIIIKGNVAAQQGIRFNIFQLHQTYTGYDERLPFGSQGFTGEKYGGTTNWGTEIFCLPFYLATAPPQVARNLLLYRYQHLPQAIANAAKLGFKNGAALFPMLTINGEECHNEWELTFEAIHRNGAIAFAIYDYIRYTGDAGYLPQYGLEVLIGISRFYAQRVNWSEVKQQYVLLGVTGPNEFENNVNNNWYTNILTAFTLQYTLEALQQVRENYPDNYGSLIQTLNLDEAKEIPLWLDITNKFYYPNDEVKGIFLQQEGYLDKEQILAKDLDPGQRPISQNWSWDRILRSCFLQQADVLLGMYLLEERYDKDTIRRNFDFYEPRTVQESSVSPGVHAILAANLGYQDLAYELYLRTARFDLDHNTPDTQDGCHLTSMAVTWQAVVKGFAGMRVQQDQLHFRPFLPPQWEKYNIKIRFREHLLTLTVTQTEVKIFNESDSVLTLQIYDKTERLGANGLLKVKR